MTQPSILYVGSSWAQRSFDSPDGSETDYTNLMRELKIDVIDVSKPSATNFECISLIKRYKTQIQAVIYVYCEPFGDLICRPQCYEQEKQMLTNPGFFQARQVIDQEILQSIALATKNIPVALIAGPSDIENCNYSNITVVHPSWQKFLSDAVGVNLNIGWAAEIAHRELMHKFKHLNPSDELIDAISGQFDAWHKMELKRVFNWCHPNRKGNELFAGEIKSTMQTWLDNI